MQRHSKEGKHVAVQGAGLAVALEPKMSEETISVGVGKPF